MRSVAFARAASAAACGLAIVGAALAAARPARAGVVACVGDCSADGAVTIDELIVGVNIALGNQALSRCNAFDSSGNGVVTVDELIRAVNAALGGCAVAPTASATDTAGVTATPITTQTATATAPPSSTPTVTATPVSNPTGLSALVDGAVVRLAWTPPDPASGFTSVTLLRRLNAAVAGPDDAQATPLFFGSASSATDAVDALLPDLAASPRSYSYAVYGCVTPSTCESIGSATTLSLTLVQALRAGGYTLYFRDASATRCADHTELGTAAETMAPGWWKRCDANCPVGEPGTATARQLDSNGPPQAMAVAHAFDALGIPVSRVVSSEYCRCLTTAQLMSFGPPIEQAPGITFFVYDEANRCANAAALIDEPPAAGSNTAIVGHAGFPSSCPPLDDLTPAQAAIVKPDGQGGATFITKLAPDEWAALIAAGPTNLSAAVDGAAIHLAWTAPDAASAFTSVRLLRRLNAPVAGPDDPDASGVSVGTANAADDDLTALLPDTVDVPRTYYYAVYGCAGAACETIGSATTVTPTLVQALHAGGYTIYWCHASATRCADQTCLGTADSTSTPNWWKSCDGDCPTPAVCPNQTGTATALQLDDTGTMEATAIGQAFTDRVIPVGRVVSSEYCRCVTTATLMGFGPMVERDPGITFFVYDEAHRCEHAYARIAEVPGPSTNTAIIGHTEFATSCPVVEALAPGEGAVFKPDGLGGSEFVAQLTWDQWATLP
jgi:phosphohistidine phosphatase SixA